MKFLDLMARCTLLCLMLYIGFTLIESNQLDLWVIVTKVVNVFLFFIFVLLLIITFFVDKARYSPLKKWYQFVPSTIGLLLLIFIIIQMLGFKNKDELLTFFTAKSIGVNSNDCLYEFKENGIFKCIEFKNISTKIQFGTYAKVGSSIEFLQFEYLNYDDSRVAMIRNDTMYWRQDTLIVEYIQN